MLYLKNKLHIFRQLTFSKLRVYFAHFKERNQEKKKAEPGMIRRELSPLLTRN